MVAQDLRSIEKPQCMLRAHMHGLTKYVTGSGKRGLIYIKCTYSYYGMYLLFCMSYPKSFSFIEFPMDFCMHGDILNTIQITDKRLLHFKLKKSGQILHVDMTCFPRPSHIQICQLVIYIYIYIYICTQVASQLVRMSTYIVTVHVHS